MNMIVLVTGGAGYIGSHCCKVLAEHGFTPVVYDNLSTGHRDAVRWGELVEGDVRDRARLEAVLQRHRPALVMHFAALALVGESVSQPQLYWDVNTGGTLSLLEAMRATGIDKLVFSSTCAVYGEPEQVPIAESAPKAPLNPYGASKLTAEWMMESFDAAHGIRSARLRYFNAFGAAPDGTIGEHHQPETHLVPLVFDAVLGRSAGFRILGTDYPTADGTAVRDFVHVLDIAAAHLAAARHLINGGASCAVNLGTGEGVSVAEMVRAVERVTGRRVPVAQAPRRPGDPARLVADPSAAARLLGWRAERSALDAAVRDAWNWHQARFGGAVGTEGSAAAPEPEGETGGATL